MKILHLLNTVSDAGNGIVNVACDLACIQAQMGHEVLVVSGGGGFEPLLTSHGVRHIPLDQSRTVGNVVPMFFKLARILACEKPDIVNCHMMTGSLLSTVLRWLGFRYKTIATVHNIYQKSAKIMFLSDRVVCLSDAVRNESIKGSKSPEKFVVIQNGTIGSPRRKTPASVEAYELRHPALVAVGAVSQRKGVNTLLKAIELAETPVHVYWVGNKDWPEIEVEIQNSPAKDRFHLVGFDSEPLRYLMGADAFILPSRRETFPLAILEAKEAGLPVISSDVDGCADALNQGKEGILVPSESASGFADAIDRVFADADLRERLSQASHDSAVRFSARHMAELYVEVYQDLLAKT
jgi:glycosyltransferase involved in cell wall biosynthesis